MSCVLRYRSALPDFLIGELGIYVKFFTSINILQTEC